jgi:site-specific DNA-methyltransferase (adenine-specific)
MAVRVEDAGFEIRDQIMWLYGSGFPKSHNIGKAVDKLQGNQREVVGENPNHRETDALYELGFQGGKGDGTITRGNSEWEGWGTALKPAHEPIVMARKPLGESTVAKNVLEYGVGGLNIDGCRVEYEDTQNPATNPKYRLEGGYKTPEKGQESKGAVTFSSSNNDINPSGRFPANIILDEEAGKILDQQSGILKSGYVADHHKTKDSSWFGASGQYSKNSTQINDLVGGASRFFYCPKVSKKERNEGVEGKAKSTAFLSPDSRMDKDNYERVSPGMERFKTQPKVNFHPTVKPTDLMAYLIRLVTPKNGVVLDPFMGSGSTGKACAREGMRFVGIEMDEEYMEIAKQRVEHEYDKRKFF